MGFYSRYRLQVKSVEESDVGSVVEAIKEQDLFNYVFDEHFYDENWKTLSFDPYEEQKWYSYEIDMMEVSKKFPELVFKLYCESEDGSYWVEYFHNGEYEHCDGYVVYDEPKKILWPR